MYSLIKDANALAVQDFAYTGAQQTYTVPSSGTYKIELWGASGGIAGLSANTPNSAFGSYTSGQISLTAGTQLYFYVGQRGSLESDTGRCVATFNGGGSTTISNTHCGATGGGATDVRTTSGAYNNATGLRSRIMVSGGGGGSTYLTGTVYGGNSAAGGLNGYQGGPASTSTYVASLGLGGTQLAGGAAPTRWSTCSTNPTSVTNGAAGAFGIGGTGGASESVTPTGGGAGGGGGYWGGSGGSGLCSGVFGGGGGSSYISGRTGSIAVVSSSSNSPRTGTSGAACTAGTTDNLCSTHYSGRTFSNSTMIDGSGYAWTNVKGSLTAMPRPSGGTFASGVGYTGDGYARITQIASTPTMTVTSVTPNQGPTSGGNAVTIAGTNLTGTNNSVANFNYTGGVQTFTASASGNYKLEVWGAQGGSSSMAGGNGGYSVGTVTLSANQQVSVYVGGSGSDTGYNGGAGMTSGARGGGASDVRIGGVDLTNRIIVAGGGGSYSSQASGGVGGGLNGGSDSSGNATGGTQNSGGTFYLTSTGSFGNGGSLANGPGGGGGWYGGSGGCSNTIPQGCNATVGGGGGSGYVFTSTSDKTGYGASMPNSSYYLANAQTIAGNTQFPATGGGTETGHAGNGYARITALDVPTAPTVTIGGAVATVTSFSSSSVTVTVPAHAAGAVNVVVNNGISTPVTVSNGYTYVAPITVTSITPDHGPIAGGTGVTITGTGFDRSMPVDFDYTGSVQTYTVPYTGQYTLEAWGAAGEDRNGSDDSYGGGGGYSKGSVTLTAGTVLYVYAGGSDAASGTWYNGARGGGDSSDVRIGTDSDYARVIVAGGGGAGDSSHSIFGGAGGGTDGVDGDGFSGSFGDDGTGGTQVSGADFSYGEGGCRKAAPGSGGGWYGGIGGCDDLYIGAGGGSGWIYTAATYAYWAANSPEGQSGNWLLNSSYYLTSAQTIGDDSTAFPSPGGSTEVGHDGDGYVRITPLTIAPPTVTFDTGAGAIQGTVTAWTDTSITVTTPAHVPGLVSVTVNNGTNSVTLPATYKNPSGDLNDPTNVQSG
ncbi:MAG: IPT/TIG domain-containing protein, partial [Candidatus Nomurabacteria bacterium]|nr:IPT/TIG domain-containing protein [Candidatus Nomurabacteria bacterium]